MRFMILVKANEQSEAGEVASPELIEKMGAFNFEMIKAGVMLDGNGLAASSQGWRINNSGGELTVVDGPFAEIKELVSGYWIIQAKSMEEAVEWIKRAPFPTDIDGQAEIRRIFELDDFPVQENESGWREEEAALRDEWSAVDPKTVQPSGEERKLTYVGFVHADARSEAGELPTEAELASVGELFGEAAALGIVVAGDGLRPTSEGKRIYFTGGEASVVDGPFTESKELVAGYSVMRFKDKEEALQWSKKSALACGEGWSEMRRVMTADDYSDEAVEAGKRAFAQST